MNIYLTEAYAEGVKAAKESAMQQHANMDAFPNPYPHNTVEWQAWNYGWNNTVAEK